MSGNMREGRISSFPVRHREEVLFMRRSDFISNAAKIVVVVRVISSGLPEVAGA